MKIFPQDLRESYHWQTVVLRANYSGGATGETAQVLLANRPPISKPVGPLGKLWLGKLPLTRPQAEMALPASAGSAQATAWLSHILLTGVAGLVGAILHKNGILSTPEAWGTMALAGGAFLYPSFVVWPRATLKFLYNKPLTVAEVEGLMHHAQTDLERDYLALVRETISQPVPEAAEADVRAAIQALGQAVDALPQVDLAPVDTDALRAEAAALRTQALQEHDRIISDSRENRADALERRANAADRSVQYARRITALQEEIAAQIAATRQDLSAFHADGGGAGVNSASFAHLADAGKRIASVAVSAAAARAELDAPLSADLREAQETIYPVAPAELPVASGVQVGIK